MYKIFSHFSVSAHLTEALNAVSFVEEQYHSLQRHVTIGPQSITTSCHWQRTGARKHCGSWLRRISIMMGNPLRYRSTQPSSRLYLPWYCSAVGGTEWYCLWAIWHNVHSHDKAPTTANWFSLWNGGQWSSPTVSRPKSSNNQRWAFQLRQCCTQLPGKVVWLHRKQLPDEFCILGTEVQVHQSEIQVKTNFEYQEFSSYVLKQKALLEAPWSSNKYKPKKKI